MGHEDGHDRPCRPEAPRGQLLPRMAAREPRRRAERAFVQVVVESYVRGVSTRRIEGLVRDLGIERISRCRVSQMAKELDSAVEAFRTRPLDGAPYTYLWLDALTQKVREGGRICNVACVVATGVNAYRVTLQSVRSAHYETGDLRPREPTLISQAIGSTHN